MATATIVIANMKSEALYVSSFHAEVFSDAGYSTLVGTKATSAVKDSSGNWTQSDMLSFTGLVRGQTYYIQAGPVSPGGVANFTRYSVQAGTLTVPSCTYAGTYTSTTSGITYDIEPANIPSDLDHYEAAWTKDGTAPSNSSLTNSWEGSALPNGFIHLFVGGFPGQEISLFFRAVSTTGGYQNWESVDSRTISALPSEGSTEAADILYADGSTVESLKPGQAGADVTATNVSKDTSAVNGINSGHVSDTSLSVGFLGKWWRTSSSNLFPASGGELDYAPMFTTHDAQINYDIYTYSSFVGAITPPSFAPYPPNYDGKYIYVRWVGYFLCSTSGTYAFGTSSDDGANLYVNGTKLISDMSVSGHGTSGNLNPNTGATGSVAMTAGDTYEIVVEYYNNGGGAGIQVMYTPPGGSGWQLFNLGTAFKAAAYTQYSDGTTVDALQPAAAGADVTAVNISKDTSAVDGVDSSHVSNSVISLGLVGKWWRASSAPSGGGELASPPMFTTHDNQLNYALNVSGGAQYAFAGQTSALPYPDGGTSAQLYVRWTGYYLAPTTGTYTFGANSDDGSNIYINGTKVVGALGTVQSAGADLAYTQSGTIALTAGVLYPVVIEFFNSASSGAVQFLSTPPGGSSPSIVNLGSSYRNASTLAYANGTTVQSTQVQALSGLSNNLVPNGDFLTGDLTGYILGSSSFFANKGLTLGTSGAGTTPTFAVQPGNKYRITFVGGVATAGTAFQAVHRILYGSAYAPNILGGAPGFIAYTDLQWVTTPYSGVQTFTYDWTCPAGVYYASLAAYNLGTGYTDYYTHLAAQDYGAAAQWGADVTSSNQSATTASLGNHTLDNLPDGPTYRKPILVSADGTYATSTPFIPQGGLIQTISQGVFSYSSTSAAISVWNVTESLPFPDGSFKTVPANGSSSSPAWSFTGLSSATGYYLSSYLDLTDGTVHVIMSDVNGGKSAPSPTQQIQVINGDGHLGLIVGWQVTTGVSGGGGGGGTSPPDPTCPADDQEIESLEKGFIPAQQVEPGMSIRDAGNDWNLVHSAWSEEGLLHHVTIQAESGARETYHVDLNHRWLRQGGDSTADIYADDWALSSALKVGDLVQGIDGNSYPIVDLSPPHEGRYRKIICERHRMRLGRLIAHNWQTVGNL